MADAIDQVIADFGPERVLAALKPMVSAERLARIDAVLDARLGSVTVAVEDTYDPHNAVAAVRTCEALGLSEFHSVDPAGRFDLAKGITRGCHRWLALKRWSDPVACARSLRERGFLAVAMAPNAAESLETLPVDQPIALFFGNEHAGLSDEAVAACNASVRIDMYGFTESFNLSVSVGLAVSRIADRRRAHLGTLGDLNAGERARLRARWVALRLKGAPDIVRRVMANAEGCRCRNDAADAADAES